MTTPTQKTTITLDRIGTAAILAALRLLQSTPTVAPTINDIMTGGGSFPPLSLDQIDALCDDINTQG